MVNNIFQSRHLYQRKQEKSARKLPGYFDVCYISWKSSSLLCGLDSVQIPWSSKFGVYLGVRTCELFLCFVPFVFLGSFVLTSCFLCFTSPLSLTSSYTVDEPKYGCTCALRVFVPIDFFQLLLEHILFPTDNRPFAIRGM